MKTLQFILLPLSLTFAFAAEKGENSPNEKHLEKLETQIQAVLGDFQSIDIETDNKQYDIPTLGFGEQVLDFVHLEYQTDDVESPVVKNHKIAGTWDNPNTAPTLTQYGYYNFGWTLDSATDEDWFRVNATSAGKLTFQLVTNGGPQTVDYQLVVYRLSGSSLVSPIVSTFPAGQTERVSVIAASGSTYFLRVLTSSGFGNSYGIYANLTTGYDSSEPNDGLSGASVLPAASGSFGGNMDSDLDWDIYAKTFNTATSMNVGIDADSGLDVVFQIFDVNGNAASAAISNHQSFNFPAGTWYIVVYQTAPSANPISQRNYTVYTSFPDTARVVDWSLGRADEEVSPGFYIVNGHCLKVKATILDGFNTPVAFAPFTYVADGVLPSSLKTGVMISNSQGKISQNVLLYPTAVSSSFPPGGGSNYDVDSFLLSLSGNILLNRSFGHFWSGSYYCN